jgi:tetratricopeptide (TPR) repeat protein
MKVNSSFILILGSFLVLPFWLQAQTVPQPYSQLLFPLADMGDGARAIAMGSAYVAIDGDISTLAWNPAGLANLPDPQITLDHDFYLQDLTEDVISFAMPAGDWGAWGLSVGYLSYGTLTGRVANGVPTGSLSAGRWEGRLIYAHSLILGFSAGLGLHLNDEAIPGNGASFTNIAGDAGVIWKPFHTLSLGASYQNFGTSQGYYIADSVIRVGSAYSFDWMKDQEGIFAVSGSFEPFGVNRLQAGLEDQLGQLLALRAGYLCSLVNNQWQGLTGFTAGLGIHLNDLSIDYAYEPYGDLGESNRISLTYQFESPTHPNEDMETQVQYRPIPKPVPAPAPVTVWITPTPIPSPLPQPQPTLSVPPTATTKPSEKLKLVFSLGEETPEPGNEGVAWKQKLQNLQDLVQQKPLDAKVWYQLGQLYFQANRKAEAIQCFEQVLRLRPNNPDLRKWLIKYKKTETGGWS